MPSESEKCVDDLLVKLAQIDQSVSNLDSSECRDQLIYGARALMSDTQTYLDGNKSLVPAYILKKVTDSLKRLEKLVDEPQKSKLQFKFKSSSDIVCKGSQPPKIEPKQVIDTTIQSKTNLLPDKLGFQSVKNQALSLGSDEVKFKDISLIDLNNCQVEINGLANTVYIRDLKDTSVTVVLACRAITVINCLNCNFNLVCQQLRIDSTKSCEFSIFTSARSMLESSQSLKFKCINLRTISKASQLQYDHTRELFKEANFDDSRNNWKCIDDFDWLSPDVPSQNFQLIENDI